jgi:hypothetical protein
MSDIFSFRLSSDNLRESQAREVIESWEKRGYSLRHIITEALLQMGTGENNPVKTSDISETVDRLERLVEKLEDRLEAAPPGRSMASELSTSFLTSIKMAAKPGIRLDDG